MKRSSHWVLVLGLVLLASLLAACSGGATPEATQAVDSGPAVTAAPATQAVEAQPAATQPPANTEPATAEPPGTPPAAALPVLSQGNSGSAPSDADFPLPQTVEGYTKNADGSANFQSSLILAELLEFYRQELTAKGLTERSILTVISDTTFNLVFDGAENGRALVIQAVDLGGGKVNVNIRYDDV